jgi:hypothetical protein
MSDLVLRLTADATVRGATTRDGLQVFSVFDSISLMCQKSAAYSRQIWKRLISDDSDYKVELEALVYTVTLCHSGKNTSYHTPAMTLRGLQRLVMILGGKVAVDFRVILEGTFTRYMSGDLSMIEEIRDNAASSAPLHQTYRQALAQEPVTNTTDTKPILDREEAIFNMELHERQMALQERSFELHERSARLPLELYERSLALHEKSLALQRRT